MDFLGVFGGEQMNLFPIKEKVAEETVESLATTEEVSEEATTMPFDEDGDMDSSEEMEEIDTSVPVAEKTKKGKASGKKAAPKETKIMLPVTVIGSNIQATLEQVGMFTLKEIYQMLFDMGYMEVALKETCLFDSASNMLYILDDMNEADEKDLVTCTKEQPLRVSLGRATAELVPEMFAGIDPESIGIEDVSEILGKVLPACKGLAMGYSSEQRVAALSFADARPFKEGENPVKMVAFEKEVPLSGEPLKKKALLEMVRQTVLSEEVSVAFCYDKANNLRVVLSAAKGAKTEKVSLASPSKGAVKKKVDKYPLPLTVWLANFGTEIVLEETSFPGKKQVTLEEIRQRLGEEYAIFRKKDKQMDSQYLKADNRLAVNMSSSKKG